MMRNNLAKNGRYESKVNKGGGVLSHFSPDHTILCQSMFLNLKMIGDYTQSAFTQSVFYLHQYLTRNPLK
jgi:hypothetical protein